MYTVTREIRFCYGHRLPGHAGKCRHLHGHNGRAVVTLAADRLDDQGMVVDFGDIKRLLGAWIDQHLDHRMLLHRDDPFVEVLRSQGEPVFIMDCPPTAENIARLLYEKARGAGLPVLEVLFWETDDCHAAYRAEATLPPLPGDRNFPVTA
jgi:6-pyruvoyltetrahydropterin/6-carboxytetrahydropterin synthase